MKPGLNDIFISAWQSSKRRDIYAKWGSPQFVARSQGPFFWDDQGDKYLDFLMGWGSIVLGHNHQPIKEIILDLKSNWLVNNLPTGLEVEVAQLFQSLYPFDTRVGFFLTGTEAVVSAVNLMRSITGRRQILTTGYCGWSKDSLVKRVDLVLENLIEEIFLWGDQLAGVIVEVPLRLDSAAELVLKLKQLSAEFGFLIVFDEVKSGLRLGLRPGLELYQVEPDLIIYGKSLAAGFPIAVLLIKAKYSTEELDSFGSTFWGWGLPLVVVKYMVSWWQKKQLNVILNQRSEQFCRQFNILFSDFSIYLDQYWVLPKLTIPQKYYQEFYHQVWKHGLYIRPKHCWFFSLSHTEEVFDQALVKLKLVRDQLVKLK